MTDIFIAKQDEQFGPYPWRQIPGLVENGDFTWDDPAWHEGMDRWEPLHVLYERLAAAAPPPSAELVEEEEPAFFSALPRAFLYPFRGPNSWPVLLFGTILIAITSVVYIFPLFGLIGGVLLSGYYIAYLFRVVMETVGGEEDVAEFPGLNDLWDDVLVPFLRMLVATVGCLLPGIFAIAFVSEEGALSWLPAGLMWAGLFYLPMALLCTIMFNSVRTGLNPFLIVPAIFRIFLRYVVIVVFLAGVIAGQDALQKYLASHDLIPFYVSFPAFGFLGFYLGIVQARILGLIYYTSASRLGWFTR